jgi:autotransporter-associated beta strand protein
LQISNSAILSGSTTNFTLNSGSALTKTGAGTLTLGGNTTYSGTTLVDSGILQLSSTGTSTYMEISSGTHTLGNLSGTGTTILSADNNLTANSIVQSTLTLGSGATLTIAAIPGGPAPGAASLTPVDPSEPVPEPSVMVLLAIAFLTFIGFGLRPKNATVRP